MRKFRCLQALILISALLLCGCGGAEQPAASVTDKAVAAAKEAASAAEATTQPSSPAEPRGMVWYSYFDTVSYVYSYAGDSDERFEKLCAGASEVLSDYNRLFDIYHEYSGINNLCTVNLNAGGEAVEVDERIVEFLLYAEELAGLTGGEMNVMLGSVLSIWHEYRSAAMDDPSAATVPDEAMLLSASGHTDLSLLEIDAERNTVRITDPDASLDVGALGKGYAVEKAAQYLESEGAESYVLNVGGNLRIIGHKPDGGSWNTVVRDPNNPDSGYAVKLRIADTACVTSGIYERFYTVNGVRYHHIIDRDTLHPADFFGSVTIITHDSGLADALSTALFCMSEEDGRELIRNFENTQVIWIYPDGNISYTDGVKSMLEN